MTSNTQKGCFSCGKTRETKLFRGTDLCRPCTIEALEEFGEEIGGSHTPPESKGEEEWVDPIN